MFETVPDDANPNVLKVNGMVEKPKAEVAPSMCAAAGRYVLDRKIFDALRRTKPSAGGEVQLTDAIALLIAEGTPCTWWCTGDRDTIWATLADISRLQSISRWNAMTTDRSCGGG